MPIIRVVDLASPRRDLGFRAVGFQAFQLRDDGSAIAVSTEYRGDLGFVPVLITAEAGASPPHLVRDPGF